MRDCTAEYSVACQLWCDALQDERASREGAAEFGDGGRKAALSVAVVNAVLDLLA